MPSCLWHSVYHLLTVAALSHPGQVPFSTTLWIPLGFILFFASVLCIFLLSCYIFAVADVERHQSYLLSHFLLCIAPDSHRHCWMFPSLVQERLSSAGDLAPTALVCSFLSVAVHSLFPKVNHRYQWILRFFQQQIKKICNSHLLRLRFSLRSGKVISVVFKFWKIWPVWGSGKGRCRRKLFTFWFWGMSSLYVLFFHLPLRNEAFCQQSLFPQRFMRDRGQEWEVPELEQLSSTILLHHQRPYYALAISAF